MMDAAVVTLVTSLGGIGISTLGVVGAAYLGGRNEGRTKAAEQKTIAVESRVNDNAGDIRELRDQVHILIAGQKVIVDELADCRVSDAAKTRMLENVYEELKMSPPASDDPDARVIERRFRERIAAAVNRRER